MRNKVFMLLWGEQRSRCWSQSDFFSVITGDLNTVSAGYRSLYWLATAIFRNFRARPSRDNQSPIQLVSDEWHSLNCLLKFFWQSIGNRPELSSTRSLRTHYPIRCHHISYFPNLQASFLKSHDIPRHLSSQIIPCAQGRLAMSWYFDCCPTYLSNLHLLDRMWPSVCYLNYIRKCIAVFHCTPSHSH